ncbi:DEAD/DEAH box helicase [Brevibacillus sp. B_LB10_24]|uniref:DEAD/DEAH box helicase n=1 Tax=Brevibacillus sp. B_LB10_24 TaxID=3380645 RepID=UPI0038BCB878
MREYLLYVKEEENALRAYVTPCFQIDKLFWQESNGQRLYVIGRSPSLALVFALREKIGKFAKTRRLTAKSVMEMQRLAAAYVREANKLYVREGQTAFRYTFRAEPVGGEDLPLEADYRRVSGEAAQLANILGGRSLLEEEAEWLLKKRGRFMIPMIWLLQWLILLNKSEWRPGVGMDIQRHWWRHRLRYICWRCSSRSHLVRTECHSCRQPCVYCSSCLSMGRSKCCTPFICVQAEDSGKGSRHSDSLLAWKGEYTPAQADAAGRAEQFATGTGGEAAFLIWAVCGAGKTELLFPAIDGVLRKGGRVLLATPRKDVVLELVPRLRAAFPSVSVRSVHGSSEEKWEEGDLIIATTHQVMRFYRCFPLVVVDEVDAFPFHNNQQLHDAVARAVAKNGKLLYLSATPPMKLRKKLTGSAAVLTPHSATHVLLARRYHGHALPVPEIKLVPRVMEKVSARRPIAELITAVDHMLAQDRQVFVFVPRVESVDKVLDYLQRLLPAYAEKMAGVHAADQGREEKVQRFRRREYMLIVTTTILERGVTIPRSDVIILGADAPVFDEASLVQIAGRVGRSADAPDGTVLFLAGHRTQALYAAKRQIEQMNRLADKRWAADRNQPKSGRES